MSFWTYLAALQETRAYEDAALHTTEDRELRDELLVAQEVCRSQIENIKAFMLAEGVPLPQTGERKPYSDPRSIPLGIKPTDEEIANGLGIRAAGAIIHCATALAQSVRTDVSIMWTRFQAEQITYATSLKVLMSKRDWLKIPPYYVPPGHHGNKS
jgi:hypothetical protein